MKIMCCLSISVDLTFKLAQFFPPLLPLFMERIGHSLVQILVEPQTSIPLQRGFTTMLSGNCVVQFADIPTHFLTA